MCRPSGDQPEVLTRNPLPKRDVGEAVSPAILSLSVGSPTRSHARSFKWVLKIPTRSQSEHSGKSPSLFDLADSLDHKHTSYHRQHTKQGFVHGRGCGENHASNTHTVHRIRVIVLDSGPPLPKVAGSSHPICCASDNACQLPFCSGLRYGFIPPVGARHFQHHSSPRWCEIF